MLAGLFCAMSFGQTNEGTADSAGEDQFRLHDVFNVDSFPVTGGKYMGAWSHSTTYPRFATVSYKGADWIAVAENSGVTPAPNSFGHELSWLQFDASGVGFAATQADCAFFTASSFVQSRARSFEAPVGTDLEFGARAKGYDKNGDWVMPSNQFGYTVSMHGRGRAITIINQTASTLSYMVSQNPIHGYNIISQEISGITFNANLRAGGCLSIHGVRRSRYAEITCFNPQQQRGGNIKYAMWIGNLGDSYEIVFEDGLVRTAMYPGSSPAFALATATSDGEITSYNITVPGAKLNAPIASGPGLVTYWTGKGSENKSYRPCQTMPDQPSYKLNPRTGELEGMTAGANRGRGCGGRISVRIQPAGTLNYGWYFGATDSTFRDIVTSGDFEEGCQFDQRGSNHFVHEHPYCAAPVQIRANGKNFHDGMELDTPLEYGLDLQAPGGDIITGYQVQWTGSDFYGAGDVLVEPGATFDTIAASSCGGKPAGQNYGGYAKFTSTVRGRLSPSPDGFPIGFAISGAEPNCDGSNSNWGTLTPPQR